MGTSLQDQANRIKGVALMRGETVADIFTDPGISGSVELGKRPAGRILLDTVTAGDVIIAAKLDRLFRSASDALLQAERFKAQGVDLIVADMGSDPVTGNGASKMFFGMMACVAEFERERIRERQRDGIAGKRRKGGYLGGSKPYGYHIVGSGPDATLVEDPHEQAGIRTMHELRATGAGYMRIAVELQRLGFPYVSHMSIKRILSRSITEDKTP